jgi:hypothetical protein
MERNEYKSNAFLSEAPGKKHGVPYSHFRKELSRYHKEEHIAAEEDVRRLVRMFGGQVVSTGQAFCELYELR